LSQKEDSHEHSNKTYKISLRRSCQTNDEQNQKKFIGEGLLTESKPIRQSISAESQIMSGQMSNNHQIENENIKISPGKEYL